MKKFLLDSKHWHLFLIVFFVPMVLCFALYIILVFSMITEMEAMRYNRGPIEDELMLEFMRVNFSRILLIYIPGIFSYVLLALWKYYLCNECNKILPDADKMKLKVFNVIVFIPTINYVIIVLSMVVMFWTFLPKLGDVPDSSFIVGYLVFLIIIMLLSILSLVAVIYSIIYAARTYKSVLLGRSANFSEYIGEFFMIMFWVVGVWIMQPKINRIRNGEIELRGNFDIIEQHLID